MVPKTKSFFQAIEFTYLQKLTYCHHKISFENKNVQKNQKQVCS